MIVIITSAAGARVRVRGGGAALLLLATLYDSSYGASERPRTHRFPPPPRTSSSTRSGAS